MFSSESFVEVLEIDLYPMHLWHKNMQLCNDSALSLFNITSYITMLLTVATRFGKNV